MSSFSKNKTLFETLRLRERRKYIFLALRSRRWRDSGQAETQSSQRKKKIFFCDIDDKCLYPLNLHLTCSFSRKYLPETILFFGT